MNFHDLFQYCPRCGSPRFVSHNEKSKCCQDCHFVYYLNPSAATVAVIINEQGELLCVRRGKEPARGTLDLPGGFSDMGETSEEGVIREVREETGLDVVSTQFLFSLPNTYRYSDLDIPTMDMFYRCQVRTADGLRAMDDAADAQWIPLSQVRPEDFGLTSIRKGVELLLRHSSLSLSPRD